MVNSTYVDIDSNHPKSLLKQIPNAVNQRINRINRLFSYKIICEESKMINDESLKNSRFQGRLEYVNPVNSDFNGRNNSNGTRALVKAGVTPIIISQIDEKK